ncbi:hypothetical protein TTHERM_00227810 (macronuclear) [Tetrahymena thermophila SB210]|uniref:Uncharacterized protein n=1 Tax=Tetrahymena thermophila (strain SB210) TaxID=312017 RepID=Q23BQ1_TETTS|nr:hypothetical protein TTHERM_00227810 [Tetrahymena thermophila SB210]EAR94067.1 hypothetical protein TTHERM_00227810 [Tetrahymena thermophila SB210]|eukprot:XP_001014312.1 hypothetical protein TTHERM_00227810 [Tetrahymena thermophila SB210]
MMKRDLQKFKYVGGGKFENVPYQNKFNKEQKYNDRDINDKRLPKWDLIYKFSDRNNINCKYHHETTIEITKFKPTRKNYGPSSNLHQVQTQQDQYKPTIKIVEQQPPKSARDFTERTPRAIRTIPDNSDELRIINEKKYLLPHMRTITPNGRPINVKHVSEFKNSEELDILNQMYHELPHMRTKTPNGRQIREPATHFISNETDFINQKKHLMPSMQNIQPEVRQNLTSRNKSQFTLAWDA